MKSKDFEDTAVYKVAQSKAVRVAAKMAGWANSMKGTIRLVYEEDVQSNPAIKELLALGEDEFRMRAAQLDVDSSQKSLAKLLLKIPHEGPVRRRLRAPRRAGGAQSADGWTRESPRWRAAAVCPQTSAAPASRPAAL